MPHPVILATDPTFLSRDGLTETVQPWEDGLRLKPVRGTFEWWYFDALFEDNSSAVIVFATKPIIRPGAPPTPNLSLTITRADGRKTMEFDLPPTSAFHADPEACNVRIGSSYVTWNEEAGHWLYRLRAETRTLAADLTFRGLVPPWRPGAGKVYFGNLNRYFAWLAAMPYGTVEGRLTYDGQEHRVRGSGYHDHNWGTVALPLALDHWYWGRAHLGNYTLIFVEQVALRKYGAMRIPVFLLAQGEQVLVDDARNFTMQAHDFVRHADGRSYPRKVEFTWQRAGERVSITLQSPRLIEATSLLLALPAWQRPWARLVANNPYYFRFSADLHLEIALASVRDSTHGTAFYEMMLLR